MDEAVAVLGGGGIEFGAEEVLECYYGCGIWIGDIQEEVGD